MKKRVLSLLLSALMMVSLLSGCCVLYTDTINADGTASTHTAVGFSDAYYKAMYDMAQSIQTSDMTFEEFRADALKDQDATSFQYNGVTYWGTIREKKTSDLTEYNNLRFPKDEDSAVSRNLSVDENGDYVLSLTFTEEEVTARASEALIPEEDTQGNSAATNTVILSTFHLPKPIGRASGEMSCCTVEGNTVVLDLFKMADTIMNRESLTFQFSTAAPPSWTPPSPPGTPPPPRPWPPVV